MEGLNKQKLNNIKILLRDLEMALTQEDEYMHIMKAFRREWGEKVRIYLKNLQILID